MSILRKAAKQKAKLRIGLSSPAGGGKTYSALLLAKGIASAWDKIALIDTENGSGDLYSSLGDYNVATLQAPFTPEKFIRYIKDCENEGMEVIVIDSITHEWEGSGGCLELNEQTARTKYKGNTWSAWSDTTARHRKFIDAIVQSKCHVITTVRNKTETAMVKNDSGRSTVQKVGTKEITRDGFEYELTLNFNVDRDTHMVTASKDRTNLFEGVDPFIITEDTGKVLNKWANDGTEVIITEPVKTVLPELTQETFDTKAKPFLRGELKNGAVNKDLLVRMKLKFTVSKEFEKQILDLTLEDLPDANWSKEKVKQEPVKDISEEDDKAASQKLLLETYLPKIDTLSKPKDYKDLEKELLQLRKDEVMEIVTHEELLQKIKERKDNTLDEKEVIKGINDCELPEGVLVYKEAMDKTKKPWTKEQKDKIYAAIEKKTKTFEPKTAGVSAELDL